MKRALSLLTIICLVITSLFAQNKVQRGYVRTVEKPDKPAKYLAGAEIKTLGNPNEATSLANGRFEIPVKTTAGKEGYTIVAVTLAGYNLVDEAKLNRHQQYTPASIDILMISKEEEERIFNELCNRLKAEMLKEHRAKLTELQGQIEAITQQNKEYETQINNLPDLVKTLIRLDYRNITDTLDIKIAEAYEKGDFILAIQLIDKKPSMQQRIEEIQTEREAVRFHEKRLTQKIEDLVRDCDIKINAYKTTFQKDSVLHYMKTKVAADSENVDYLLEIGDYFCEYLAEYDSALKYCRSALKLAEHKQEYSSIARSYTKIGSIYNAKGDISNAFQNIKKAIDIWDRYFDDNHPNYAESLNSLGVVYNTIHEFDSAYKYFQKALDIRIKLYGNNHYTVALGFNNLAILQANKSNNENALKSFESALDIFKNTLGETDLHTIQTIGNICVVLANLNRYDTAIQILHETIQREINLLGEYHPDVALGYVQLAGVYSKLSKDREALDYYIKARDIYLSSLGEVHVEMIKTYHAIATQYKMMKDYDTALVYANKTLEIASSLYGYNHPEIARYLITICHIYIDLEQVDSAMKYLQQAQNLLEKTPDLEYASLIASIYQTQASIYEELDDYNKALELNQKSLEIYQKLKDSDGEAGCYFNIADNYLSLGDLENAAFNALNAINIWESIFKEANLKTFKGYYIMTIIERHRKKYDTAIVYYHKMLKFLNSQSNPVLNAAVYNGIGLSFTELGMYDSAAIYFQECLPYMEQTYGQNNPSVSKIYTQLANAYMKQGDFNKAKTVLLQSLSIDINHYGEEQVAVAEDYYNIGELCAEFKDFPSALENYNKALAIYETTKGKKSPEALEVKQAIKECKKKMKGKK